MQVKHEKEQHDAAANERGPFDCEHGKYINLLCMVLDTDACMGSNSSECYQDGQVMYPDMANPDSTTVWPFYDAIQHVYFTASETKQVVWNTGIDTSSGSEWAVWVQGEYVHK